MADKRTILRNLKNLNQFVIQFSRSLQPTHFEHLIAETLSKILFLPFYTADNDDTTVNHRVAWQGNINPVSKAPGGPDAIAYCHNFYLIIEASLNTGVRQWSREFGSSIRHCNDFVKQKRIQPNDVYIVLITPALHPDTYRSISTCLEYSFIPIETSIVAKILETSILAITMRHIEFRKFLNQVSECLKTPTSLKDFNGSVDKLLTNWQKEVLKLEKTAFIGIKSYETMHKIDRSYIGISEIERKLQPQRKVNKYLKIIDDTLSTNLIEKSLIQQSLGYQLARNFDNENIFSPVPFEDFKARKIKLIDKVKRING